MRAVLFTAALAAAGCIGDSTDSTEQRDEVDNEYECECKIEGSLIGQVGARVHVGDELVVFEDWVAKVDSPGEYVGFLLSANAGDVSYVVKAGTARFEASGITWMSPYGDSGPDAQGISNVDFCEDDDYPPDEEEPPPEDVPDIE
jgi:hypothetical protein